MRCTSEGPATAGLHSQKLEELARDIDREAKQPEVAWTKIPSMHGGERAITLAENMRP